MIKLFSEEVNPTFTSSNHNILTVEGYNEVFFDVFEFEINGTTYIAEKTSEYKGKPVVAVPVIDRETKCTIPFVLSEGTFEVLYNKTNTKFTSTETEVILDSIMVDDEVVDIARDYKADLLAEVDVAKRDAAVYAENIKSQKIADAEKIIQEKKQGIKEFFDNSRVDLLDEFNEALVNNKKDVEVYTEQVKKGVDKALSRVGNVKADVIDLESQLLDRIEAVDGSIREYYDTRIDNINSDITVLTESQKDYFVKLIEESKVHLLEQIQPGKDSTVKSLIQEKYDPAKSDKDFAKSIKKLKADLDKELADRFRNEVTSLKRIIGMSGGGGGSVAKQFAAGGVMSDDLKVEGCVTAECFITNNPNSKDYTRAGIVRDEGLLKDVSNTTCTFPININPALSTAKFHVTYTSATSRSFVELWIAHMDGNCFVSGYSIINTDEVNPLLVSVDCNVSGECLNIISVVSSDCVGVFSGNAVYVDDPNYIL